MFVASKSWQQYKKVTMAHDVYGITNQLQALVAHFGRQNVQV